MNKKSRRKALKALAVSAPAVWAKPAVDTIMLPAHAQTTCDGCFLNGFNDPNSSASFTATNFPAGIVMGYENDTTCNGDSFTVNGVVASHDDEQAALDLYEAEFGPCTLEFAPFLSLQSPCEIWVCIDP